MKVGVLADIHANRVALDAVLTDMPAVDTMVCAGDVVGYNPWPAECVETIRDRDIPTVMGNHDRAVVGGGDFRFNSMAGAGVEYARRELSASQREWLSELPDERHEIHGQLKLVHGHPEDPDRYTYPGEFGPGLLADEDVLIMGHTHVQHAEQFEAGIVLNPGSVGQPRDGDPQAAYAILDLDGLSVETHRVEYDVEEVVDAVAAAGLPERTGARLRRGE